MVIDQWTRVCCVLILGAYAEDFAAAFNNQFWGFQSPGLLSDLLMSVEGTITSAYAWRFRCMLHTVILEALKECVLALLESLICLDGLFHIVGAFTSYKGLERMDV